jgi:hypothetical protein
MAGQRPFRHYLVELKRLLRYNIINNSGMRGLVKTPENQDFCDSK